MEWHPKRAIVALFLFGAERFCFAYKLFGLFSTHKLEHWIVFIVVGMPKDL